MERNPKEKYIKYFMNSIKIKTFIPRGFWYRCDKCGMEYRRELMYKGIKEDTFFRDENSRIGCCHCFKNSEDFKRWLNEINFLYSEEYLSELYDNPSIRWRR